MLEVYSCFFFQDAMFRTAWNTLRSLIRHECRPNCRWGIVCWSSSRRQLITAGHSMGGAQAELFSACANRHRPHHDMVRWAGKMLGHEGGHEDSRQMRNSCNSQLMFWVCHGQSGFLHLKIWSLPVWCANLIPEAWCLICQAWMLF